MNSTEIKLKIFPCETLDYLANNFCNVELQCYRNGPLVIILKLTASQYSVLVGCIPLCEEEAGQCHEK